MLQNKKRRTRQALQNRENEIVLWIGLTASIGGRRLRYNIRILRRLPSHEMTIALLMVFSGFDWWVLLYPDCESVVCSHAPWIIDIRQVSLSSTGWRYPVRVRVARWMHGCYPSFNTSSLLRGYNTYRQVTHSWGKDNDTSLHLSNWMNRKKCRFKRVKIWLHKAGLFFKWLFCLLVH
jgi:hypothetical protein